MSFPRIKRFRKQDASEDWAMLYPWNQIMEERKSRAKWVRAIREYVLGIYRGEGSLKELDKELLAEAEKDEGTK